MQKASCCPKHLKLTLTLCLIIIGLKTYSQNIPLANAYAHNDYWHKRPLYDALDNGFTHIEADVYLRHGKLVVAHILPVLRRHRDLEQLYFKPLFDCINGTNTQTACPAFPLMLMIDIKSGADKTYGQLQVLFEKYKSMLSGYQNGLFIQRQLTIVITGHKPYQLIKEQTNRFAFIDADLIKAGCDTAAKNVYQTASCRYSRILQWKGQGDIPAAQKIRLQAYVDMAHKSGEKVRLWASPENQTVWKELLSCGVDLINTDKLVDLKNFLISDIAINARANSNLNVQLSTLATFKGQQP